MQYPGRVYIRTNGPTLYPSSMNPPTLPSWLLLWRFASATVQILLEQEGAVTWITPGISRMFSKFSKSANILKEALLWYHTFSGLGNVLWIFECHEMKIILSLLISSQCLFTCKIPTMWSTVTQCFPVQSWVKVYSCPLLPGLEICSFAQSLFALLLICSSLFCSKSLILKSNCEQFALVIL